MMILLSDAAISKLESVFGDSETFYNWQTYEEYEELCYSFNEMLEEDAAGKDSMDYIATNILTQIAVVRYSLDNKAKTCKVEIICIYLSLTLDFLKPFDFYYNFNSSSICGNINVKLYKPKEFLDDLKRFIRNIERQAKLDVETNYTTHFKLLTCYDLCDTINNILSFRNLDVVEYNCFNNEMAKVVQQEVNTSLCVLIISMIRFGVDDVNYLSKQSEVELKRLISRLRKSNKFNENCYVLQIETIFNMLNIKLNIFQ